MYLKEVDNIALKQNENYQTQTNKNKQTFKNTKMILQKNAVIWFNKTCKTRGLQPKYISLQTNERTQEIARQHNTL